MHSLYLKIFLWFWLAATVLVVAVAWTSRQVAELSAWPARDEARAAAHAIWLAGVARDRIAADGSAAVRRLLDERRRHRHRRAPPVFVVDASGRDLLGRPLPPAVRAALAAPGEQRGGGPVLLGTASDASGQRFRIAVPLPGARGDAPQAARAGGERTRRGWLGRIVGGPPSLQWTRLAVSVLVSGAVCYLLARYLAGPLRRLRETTHAFAGGDLAVRVDPRVSRRRDEIGDLGRELDAMAARTEALVTAQRRLLRDVSHELRSPLARVRVALELARRRAGADAAADLDRIDRESERLDDLIGRILVLARLEEGMGAAALEPVDLLALAGEVAADAAYEAGADARPISVEGAVPRGDAVRVRGREDQLRSVLENLVRNALHHTPAGAPVAVRVRREGGWGVVEVRDRGPGVPEAALAHLFEPFYRVDDARDRGSGGHGIGLAIVERVVRNHRGEVRASNAADGGLEVTVRLPVDGSPGGRRPHA